MFVAPCVTLSVISGALPAVSVMFAVRAVVWVFLVETETFSVLPCLVSVTHEASAVASQLSALVVTATVLSPVSFASNESEVGLTENELISFARCSIEIVCGSASPAVTVTVAFRALCVLV